MTIQRHATTIAASAALVLFLAPTAEAQNQRNQNQRNQGQRQNQNQNQNQRNQQRSQQQRNQGQQRQQGQQGQDLVLDSWVRIAYDFDNDNRWDAVEWVFGYDLAQAQESSRRRRENGQSDQQGRGNMQQRQRQGQRSGQMGMGQQRGSGQQGQFGQQNQQSQLTGTIQQMSTRDFAGVQEPHLVAIVETNSGRQTRVDLGPRSKVRQLDLQRGDRVQLSGRRGTLNKQNTFIAERIRTNNGSTSVQRQKASLERIEGKIVDTRSVNFRESGTEHVLALVEKQQSGKKVLVDLGPRSQLHGVSFQQGDQVTVLACPGRIQQQQAMFAETIRTQDGQTVTVKRQRGNQDRSGNMNRSGSQSRSGNMDRGNQNGSGGSNQGSNSGNWDDTTDLDIYYDMPGRRGNSGNGNDGW